MKEDVYIYATAWETVFDFLLGLRIVLDFGIQRLIFRHGDLQDADGASGDTVIDEKDQPVIVFLTEVKKKSVPGRGELSIFRSAVVELVFCKFDDSVIQSFLPEVEFLQKIGSCENESDHRSLNALILGGDGGGFIQLQGQLPCIGFGKRMWFLDQQEGVFRISEEESDGDV